jgi:Holliday junction resolvasome RuvABC ATP-dependent DNA helicase subunit
MLLRSHWAPTGVQLPKNDVSSEVAAAITRLTRGNFRLLTRLLTQMQRVVEINQLNEFSIDVVETARENLVIGQA